MNCIHCGKPIDRHEAGRETDICTGNATGVDYTTVDYNEYPTPFTDRMAWAGACISHLTADDNPIENVMMFWDRSNYKWAIEINMMCKPGSQEWSNYHVTADTLPLALCRAVLTLEAVEANDG